MPKYTCDPRVELTGQTVLSLVQNIQHQDIEPILKKHNLNSVDPNAWYFLQDVLNVLSDVSDTEDAMTNFISIGIAAVEVGYIPPEMQSMTVAEFLTAYGKIYQIRHRGGDPGSVTIETVSPNHLKLILKIPYPDDVFYGIMYAYTRRFRPAGAKFLVRYDDTVPRREEGGEATILHITWDEV